MVLIHHLVNGICVFRFHAGCQSVAMMNNVPNFVLAVLSHVLNALLEIFVFFAKVWSININQTFFKNQQLLCWMQAQHDTLQHGVLLNLQDSLKFF
jgi:hypothetical protein